MSFNQHPSPEYRTRCGQFCVLGRDVWRADESDKSPVSEAESKAARAERDAAMRTSARGAKKNR